MDRPDALQELHDELYRAQRTERVEAMMGSIGKARLLLARYRDSLSAAAGDAPARSLLRKADEPLVCYCPPGVCQAPKGFKGPCNRAAPAAPTPAAPLRGEALGDAEVQAIHSLPYVRDCLLRYAHRPCDDEAAAVVKAIATQVAALAQPATQGPTAKTDREWFEFCRPYVYLNGSHEMPNYAAICRAVIALAQPVPADPMDWPLPCDVTVGHRTMAKGVALRTLVLRMKVLYEMATGNDADAVASRTLEDSKALAASFLAAVAPRAGAEDWCCEKGQAAGVPVCDECAEISAGYSAAMAPRAEPDDTPLETGEGDAR